MCHHHSASAFALLVTCLSATASAQAPTAERPGRQQAAPADQVAIVAAEVLQFERDVEAAVVRGDVAFVDAASAPTFTFTHGDGWTTGGPPLRVDSREDWLATVAKAPYASRTLDSVRAEVHADVVITYGRYVGRFKDAAPGRRQFTVWYQRVYAKRNARWQYLSHRTVDGPDYEPPPGPAADSLPADVYADSRSRLPLVHREGLDELGQRLFDESVGDARIVTGLQGPRGLRLHSPKNALHVRDLMNYVRFDGALDARTVELAVLTAAREVDSQFVWTAHEAPALKAGVPPEVVETVRWRRPTGGLPEQDAALIELGREAMGQRPVSPATYARALKVFGARRLVDLATVFGEYAATAVLLNTFDQQLPAGQAPPLPQR